MNNLNHAPISTHILLHSLTFNHSLHQKHTSALTLLASNLIRSINPPIYISFTHTPLKQQNTTTRHTSTQTNKKQEMAKSIEKMSPDEILAASKKLFFGGFALLPLLWVYNILYIWPVRNRADLNPRVRHCKFSLLISFDKTERTSVGG